MEITLVVIAIFMVIGLCATIDIGHPVFKEQKDLEGRPLYYLVLFCIATITAPIWLQFILNPLKGELFRVHFKNALFKD